jgi:Carbohydrate binding domain (family 11).
MARDIASPTLSAIPAVKAQELIDDFERANGRSQLDTLWVNSSDAGVDPSKIVFGRVRRETNNQALSVSVRMSEKERPFARVSIPLSRGAIEPADARAFRGVQFDTRGDGEYRLIVPIYNTRSASSYFSVPFNASPQWQTLKLDFASFKQTGSRSPVQWTGADLLMLSFEVARPAGSFGWLELDNIKFYR